MLYFSASEGELVSLRVNASGTLYRLELLGHDGEREWPDLNFPLAFHVLFELLPDGRVMLDGAQAYRIDLETEDLVLWVQFHERNALA